MVIGKKMVVASTSNALIDVKNICFQRDWQIILHNFNLKIFPAQWVLLKGRNGSGKTTLIKLLTGLLSPQAGSIRIKGTYSYLGHQNGVKPYLTLKHFLKSLPISSLQKPALSLVNKLGMSPYLEIPFSELSAGLKRRFALVQLLTPSVDLYIVDEPFEYLDQETVAIVWGVLQEKINQGASLLMTHHGSVPSDISLQEVILDV